MAGSQTRQRKTSRKGDGRQQPVLPITHTSGISYRVVGRVGARSTRLALAAFVVLADVADRHEGRVLALFQTLWRDDTRERVDQIALPEVRGVRDGERREREPPPRRRRPLLAPALELRRCLLAFRVPLPTALLQLPPLAARLPPRVFSTAVCAIRALFHCYVRNAGVQGKNAL